MKLDNIKVHKMGNKLGIYFSKLYFQKGSLVQIRIIKEGKQKEFLAKFNRIIALRNDIIDCLNLKYLDLLTLEIQKTDNSERTKEIFAIDKIDMLALVPQKTSKGYEIFVKEFNKNNEEWIRIWYVTERRSGRQIEIRRYIDIQVIGSLLGQYQAEGTKHKNNNNKFRVEFKNRLVKERTEFLNSLVKIGISSTAFKFRFLVTQVRFQKKKLRNMSKNLK